MAHGIITFGICLAILVFDLPWPLMLLPAMAYLGREHAQAEYRYIETHGGKRDKCPWYCGYLPQSWTLKGLLDAGLPVIASAVVIILQVTGALR